MVPLHSNQKLWEKKKKKRKSGALRISGLRGSGLLPQQPPPYGDPLPPPCLQALTSRHCWQGTRPPCGAFCFEFCVLKFNFSEGTGGSCACKLANGKRTSLASFAPGRVTEPCPAWEAPLTVDRQGRENVLTPWPRSWGAALHPGLAPKLGTSGRAGKAHWGPGSWCPGYWTRGRGSASFQLSPPLLALERSWGWSDFRA